MKILLFGPFNGRSRDNESLMRKFIDLGHSVYFLTTEEGNHIIPVLENMGVLCYKMNIEGTGKISLFKKVFFLVRFIKKHKIQVVFSHLEPSGFIAVLAQHFVKARIIVVRHHSDLFVLNNLNNISSYRYIYNHAKDIIVVSHYSKKVMIEKEGFAGRNIHVVPLSFDFSAFDQPSPVIVNSIKKSLNLNLLLLSVGRLVSNKRMHLSIEILHGLRQRGVDAGLLIVGDGELEEELQHLIDRYQLSDYCRLEGYKANVMDYVEACDIFLHPSESEASSLVIKEAGLRKKVVVACKEVGDCGEYIENGRNGFLLSKDDFVAEAVQVIASELQDSEKRAEIGSHLYDSIFELYDVEKNIAAYNQFLH